MATLIRLRRDTTNNWESENPILHLAEPGVELDVNNQVIGLKIGDGETNWTNLDYLQSQETEVPTDRIIGLEYDWDGFRLGIKREDEEDFTYITLRDDSYSESSIQFDQDQAISNVIIDGVSYQEKVWTYQNYPISKALYKENNFKGNTIVNYFTTSTGSKRISGLAWWSDRKAEDYQDLIKVHFEAGVPVASNTNWENFIDSNNIIYIANNRVSMEVLANSEEAKDPITNTERAMNAISRREISREVIGKDTLLYNTILEKEMAVGKYIAGYADIDPRNFNDVGHLLSVEASVNIVLNSLPSLEVLTDSQVAMETASNQSTFTINLAYHEEAMYYIVEKPIFLSELIKVDAACEHLIDTEMSRNIIFNNDSAFYLFISNSKPMEVIATHTAPAEQIYTTPNLLGKLFDVAAARELAFNTGTFVGNFIYHEPAINQLVNHDQAVDSAVNINTMMEAVVFDEYAFGKFAEKANILNMMIFNENVNGLMKGSSIALSKLYDMDPITVPILTEPENSSASSYQSSRPAYQAFNDNPDNWWETSGGNVTNEWVAYNFNTNVWCFAIQILGTGNTACPKDCKMQYHDGTNWQDATSVFTVQNQSSNLQEFLVFHPVKSDRWRLFILNNYGSSLRIEIPKLQFYCQ